MCILKKMAMKQTYEEWGRKSLVLYEVKASAQFVLNEFHTSKQFRRKLRTSCILRNGYTVGNDTSTLSSIADNSQVTAPLYKRKRIIFRINSQIVISQ